MKPCFRRVLRKPEPSRRTCLAFVREVTKKQEIAELEEEAVSEENEQEV